MRIVARLRSLYRTLFRRERVGRELDAELESYLRLLIDEKVAAGMDEREARRAARLELGGLEQVKADVREHRVGASLETVMQDVRFALRQFRREPYFAAVAVLTLALGIGANTAVFSVVNRVLFRPLPYPDEDRVVTVWNTHVDGRLALSEQEFLEYASLDDVFESLGVYVEGSFALSGEGEAERLPGIFAHPAALESARPRFVAGRAFLDEEDVPGSPPVALIAESLWERRFGRDSDVIGRTVTLNGRASTVTGVLPEGFRLPGGFTGPAPLVVAPLQLDPADPDPRNLHYLNAIGRLREGASMGRARSALNRAAGRVAGRLGTLPETFSATAIPVREDVVGSVRPVLLLLLGAVGLVLLVACVNIANVLLARSDRRVREMAVRASLGAGRGRLVRQLATETAVLAVFGGTAGLALGWLGARALVAASPPGVPRLGPIGVDPGMFVFCLAITLATGLLVGLLPARRLARRSPAEALKGQGPAGGGRSGTRTRRALVTAQIALAATLSIAAGLLVRSVLELRTVEPGYDDTGVLTFQTTLPSASYPDARAVRDFYERLRGDLAALPGVVSVGGTTHLPMASSPGDWGVRIRGRGPDGVGERGPAPDWIVVTPGYFEAMGIPIPAGRPFGPADAAGGFQTVVISEAFASRHWPQGEALGAQLRMTTNIDTLWRTVVGIAADVRQAALDQPPRPTMYLPHAQFPSTTDDLVIGQLDLTMRSRQENPAILADGVRAVAARLDPQVPVANLRTMGDVSRAALADHAFQSTLLGAFAAMALVLVVIGVYGVTAYLVSRRRREIGLRIALGASPGRVRFLVLREGLAMTGLGIGAGVAAAWLLTRLMAGILYGVTAHDPLTFVAVPALLALTALLSSAIPAARAARVDPQEALRHD